MANAKRDENGTPTMLGTLQSNGVTPVLVYVNPSTNSIKVVDSSSGSNLGSAIAKRDENSVPVLMGVSSADGVTPVPIATDESGNLLIQST